MRTLGIKPSAIIEREETAFVKSVVFVITTILLFVALRSDIMGVSFRCCVIRIG
jgi:hypothetical protein